MIKQIPEDFHVKEIMERNLGEGDFSYYQLTKKNIDMISAISIIAERFGIKEKYINYAGIKDKKAITEQTISIYKGSKIDLSLPGLELKFLGKAKDRINLGDLKGNYFEIVVRDIAEKPMLNCPVPNYFDEQRFGARLTNHVIGKHIVKKEFREAAFLIPETQDFLAERPNDFVVALAKLSRKKLLLFMHAYQSFLWNRVASRIIEEYRHKGVETRIGKLNFPLGKTENRIVPLIGFGTDDNIYSDVLKEEGITARDFIIRQIPGLSMEGGERKLLIDIKDLKVSDPEDDELNPCKKKVKVSFVLPPGSYATMVVKAL